MPWRGELAATDVVESGGHWLCDILSTASSLSEIDQSIINRNEIGNNARVITPLLVLLKLSGVDVT